MHRFIFLICLLIPVQVSAQTASTEASLDEVRQLLSDARYEEALTLITQVADDLEIPVATVLRLDELEMPPVILRNVLLYRAIALEMLGAINDARHNYGIFLRLEPSGGRAAVVRERLPNLNARATQALAQSALSDTSVLDASYAYETSRFSIAVIPFKNISDLGIMDQFGYASGGFLQNALSLLSQYVDMPFDVVDRPSIKAALDVVTLPGLYPADSSVTARRVAQLLGADYAVTGSVDAVIGNVLVNPYLGHVSGDSVYTIVPLHSSMSAYTAEGARNLQRDLAIRIADKIQEITGFNYVPNRLAYADTLDRLALDNINQYLAYGAGYELLLAGNYAEAGRILNEAVGSTLAVMEQAGIEAIQSAEQAPSQDITDLLQRGPDVIEQETDTSPPVAVDPPTTTPQDSSDVVLIPPDEQAQVEEEEPDLAATDPQPDEESEASQPPVPPGLHAIQMLSQMGAAALGAAAIHDFTTGSDRIEAAREDPRNGKSGVLDPTRQTDGSVSIRIVVPVPPAGGNSSKKEK